MTTQISKHLIPGRGIYSLPEAARYSRVPSRTIRRWVDGYSYPYKGDLRKSTPAMRRDYAPIQGQIALSFADLIEVRLIAAFLKYGVSLKTIRAAYIRAVDLFKYDHPLVMQRFKTDGKSIFTDIASENEEDLLLLDLVKNQYAFREIVALNLKGIDFSKDGIAAQWWPMERRNSVVLDPTRSFGKPIVNDFGVPTEILAASFNAEQSIATVANIFDVTERAVKDSVEFEQQLAA